MLPGSALEEVKRDLRSMLISEKDGVPLRNIQRDYEMLSCNRLPFKDLGFVDVQSFMRSIPDVARESRGQMGEVSYFAVCDASTSHIQKLVSNQKSKKKKVPKFSAWGRGGMRGGGGIRGGMSRGGYRGGSRGGRGGGGGGGYGAPLLKTPFRTDSSFAAPARPRPPQIMRGDDGGRWQRGGGGMGMGGWRGGGGRGGGGGIPRVSSAADPSTGQSGDWRNKGAQYSSSGLSTFINGQQQYQQQRHNHSQWGDDRGNNMRGNAFMGESGGDRGNNTKGNAFTGESGGDWDKENQSSSSQTSPLIRNLRIGVDSKGNRMVDKNAEEREKERDLREQINNSKAKRFQTATTTTMNNNDDDEDVESQFDGDLRQKLNQMRNAFVESDESSVRGDGGGGGGLSVRGRDGMNTGWHNHDTRMQEEGGVGGGDGSGNAGPTRKATFVPRQTNNNKHFNKTNPSDIPPRFRKLQQGSSLSRPDGGFTPEIKTEPISPIQHTETYEDTTVFYNIESKNWVPPENGWRYLQAFHDYFAQRGVPAPVINVVMGKVERQKGFYGQTQYDNKMYYPLEILSTEEEARQNAARAFCLKMGVSLQQPSPPLPTASMSETVKKNIYNIVSDSGIWANGLPDLYKKTYNEELPADFLRSLQHSAHLFNIEEPVPKRFIIYKVLESVVKLGQIVQMEDRQAEDSTLMWCSPPLPDIGSQLKVLFSYAYSGQEIYLQKAEHEDLLYQIEEVLQTLSQQSPPLANANLASSLVAACYEEGWYRAKVLEVQRETVLVSFVDYGNRESVTRKDVRHLPSDKLVTLTPPLAISCCLQKPTGVEWKEDITSILFSLSESETGLSAKVLAHRDTQCVIDLCLPSGESLASRLTRPHSTSTSTPTLTHSMSTTSSSSSPPPPPTPSPPPPPATVEEEGEESTATTVTSSTPPPSSSSTPPPPSSTPPPPPVPSPTAMAVTSQTTAAAATLATPDTQQHQLSTSFLAKQTTRLFAEDPEPLCLPEADLFAIFVCRVLTESSILLRFVDDEYSDKLDQLESQIADRFQSWPTPKEVHKSNVYACVILPSQTEEDDDDDEEDEEGDGNKFYRARVLHKKEDGTYECYLLDHGDHETVPQGQLREIDSSLNTSLPYQAILASLYGLDSLTPEHRAVAVEALIKFTITDCSTFMAMRRDGGQPQPPQSPHQPHHDSTTTMAPLADEDSSGDTKMDPIIINRVRKVICCLKEIVPDQVVKIYHDVYKEHLENVEEIIRQIPGYGFWKRSLEVELFDTSQDEDFSVNQTILSLLAEVTQLQAEGKDGLTAIHNYFGDSGGSASIDSKSVGDGKETTVVDAATGNLDQQRFFDLTASSSGHSQSQSQTATLVAAVRQQNGDRTMDRVFSYVQEQADSVAASASSSSTNYHLQQQQIQQQEEGEESPAARSLYTWSTNVNNDKDAQWMSSRPVGGAAGVAGTGHQNTPSISPPTPSSTHHHAGGGGGGGSGGELDGQFPPLPSWYGFELNNFSALFVLHAESPSDFVAIPYDMRQPLLQMEEELTQYFSVPQKETEVLSRSCLYAVNRDGVWHRTLYISSIEHVHRVLYPDYHQFDTVSLEQLYPLPQLFYSLPFLGRKMALGGVAPTSQDWPESVKFWFIQNTRHRNMYGLIWDYVDSGPNNDSDSSGKESFVDSRVPKPLRAQLVDTSGEEDVIVDDVLCDKGWARHIQPE